LFKLLAINLQTFSLTIKAWNWISFSIF